MKFRLPCTVPASNGSNPQSGYPVGACSWLPQSLQLHDHTFGKILIQLSSTVRWDHSAEWLGTGLDVHYLTPERRRIILFTAKCRHTLRAIQPQIQVSWLQISKLVYQEKVDVCCPIMLRDMNQQGKKTSWLVPCILFVHDEPSVPQVLRNFILFYGNLSLITVFLIDVLDIIHHPYFFKNNVSETGQISVLK
jgi:hypothetical protein